MVKLKVKITAIVALLLGVNLIYFAQMGFAKEFPIALNSEGVLVNEENYNEREAYRLPLGGLKRQQGVLLPEESKKIDAKKKVLTREYARTNLLFDLREYYLRNIANAGFRLLYQCEAMECGPNAHWANVVFKQRKLTGLGRTQQLFTFASEKNKQFLLFYIVQRGNKNIYVHMEWYYDLAEQNSNTLARHYFYQTLMAERRVVLTGLKFDSTGLPDSDDNQNIYQAVADILQSHPELKLALVGHDRNLKPVSDAISNSAKIAQFVVEEIEKYTDTVALTSHGVGPFAPVDAEHNDSSDPDIWVELVLLP